MTDWTEALSRFYREAPVGSTFLLLCLLFTLPSLVDPGLYEHFGGIAPRQHAWQPVTAAFMHGWPGVHGAFHLALNLFLIVEVGRPCERLLGSVRFFLLSLMALLVNAAVISVTEGVNGSSVVIWAWGPPLYVALRRGASRDPEMTRRAGYQRIMGLLVLMYVVITLGMAFLPYLFGWRGHPVEALVRANLYHLVATAVGIALSALWKPGAERA